MSWRLKASQKAQQEMDGLFTACTNHAIQLLNKGKDNFFAPFACVVTKDYQLDTLLSPEQEIDSPQPVQPMVWKRESKPAGIFYFILSVVCFVWSIIEINSESENHVLYVLLLIYATSFLIAGIVSFIVAKPLITLSEKHVKIHTINTLIRYNEITVVDYSSPSTGLIALIFVLSALLAPFLLPFVIIFAPRPKLEIGTRSGQVCEIKNIFNGRQLQAIIMGKAQP